MFRLFQQFALFLVGFSLPIQAYSLADVSSFGVTPSKLATAVLLLLAVIQFGLTRRPPPPDDKRLWLLVFVLSYAISSVAGLASGVEPAVILISGTTFAALVLYYLLIGYVVRSRRDLSLLLWALVLGGAATAAPAVLGLRFASRDAGHRYIGLAGQENLFGFDMAVCVPIGVALFFATRSLIARTLLLGLTSLCMGGLLLSLSRSALLSAAVMGAFWLWRSGRIENLRYLLPAVALAGGVLLFAPSTVEERIETVTDPAQRAADRSIQSRLEQYQWAARAVASNPAIGVGVMNFVPWVRSQPGGSLHFYEIHNAVLAVAARQGLLGAIPYVALLLLTWTQYARTLRIVRARRRLRDKELAGLGHVANFLQIAFLGGLVGSLFGMAHNSKTMWLLLGLSPALLAMSRMRAAQLEAHAGPARPEQAGLLPSPRADAGQPV